jgi:hypothetical protein
LPLALLLDWLRDHLEALYPEEYDFGKCVFRLLLTSPCSCVPIILVV